MAAETAPGSSPGPSGARGGARWWCSVCFRHDALSPGALAGLGRHRPRSPNALETAADVTVLPGQVGLLTTDWDRLAEEPEIGQIAVWALLFGNFDPEALPPEAQDTAALEGGLVFVSVDGTWLGEVGRPVVVEGRMYDRDRRRRDRDR